MLISMIQRSFSKENKYLKKQKILDAVVMASFLPGPMAINVASYIGFLLKGWKGALVSFNPPMIFWKPVFSSFDASSIS